MLHSAEGTLRYSGTNRLVVEFEQELVDYYLNLIPRCKNVTRQRYAAHITVVRPYKESPVVTENWGKYEGQKIEFLYDSEVKFGQVYYWLNVLCKPLEFIRIELGLPCVSQYTEPPEGYKKWFHTTIGNVKSEMATDLTLPNGS